MTSSFKQLEKPKLKLVIEGFVSSGALADQTEKWKNRQHEKLCQSSDQSNINRYSVYGSGFQETYKLHQSTMLKLATTSLVFQCRGQPMSTSYRVLTLSPHTIEF